MDAFNARDARTGSCLVIILNATSFCKVHWDALQIETLMSDRVKAIQRAVMILSSDPNQPASRDYNLEDTAVSISHDGKAATWCDKDGCDRIWKIIGKVDDGGMRHTTVNQNEVDNMV